VFDNIVLNELQKAVSAHAWSTFHAGSAAKAAAGRRKMRQKNKKSQAVTPANRNTGFVGSLQMSSSGKRV